MYTDIYIYVYSYINLYRIHEINPNFFLTDTITSKCHLSVNCIDFVRG